MRFTISLNNLMEMVMENSFPENYHDPAGGITESTTHFQNAYTQGSYHQIFFEGMHIAYGDMRWNQETELQFESDYETVEMHFDLCGSNAVRIENAPSYNLDFTANRHNIIYVPGIKGTVRFSMNSVRTLEINLRPSLFSKYLGEGDTFNEFLQMIRTQCPAFLGREHLPITTPMMQIIHSILNCNKKGIYRRMFLEAKVIELLMLELEQFATQQSNSLLTTKKTDIEKMYHARDIIMNQLRNPCSLIDLARQVGTNEFTLKKGFKEVFGTTVFGMVAELKMEQARELLLSGEKNIAEVSDLTGYSHQAHFTKAFKKKYGMPPRDYFK